MSEEKKEVSRRGYVKYAAAGIIVVAGAAAGGYYATRPREEAGPVPEGKKYEGMEFTVYSMADPTNEAFAQMAEKYGEMTGMSNVNAIFYDWDHLREKLVVELSGKGNIDMSLCDDYWIGEFEEYFTPWEDMVEERGYKDFDDLADGPIDAMRNMQGKIICHPQMTDIVVYAYRKDIFEKHGLTPPEDEAGLWETCEIIKEEETDKGTGVYALGDQWGPGYQSFTFGDWLYHEGGEFLNQDFEPVYNSDAGVRALEKEIRSIGYAPPNALEMNHEILNVSYLTGEIAMCHQWWTVSGSMLVPEDNPYFDVTGFFGKTLKKTCAGMMGFGIPAFATPERQDAAYNMLEWVFSKENAAELIERGGVPIRDSTFADETIKNEKVPIPEQWDAAARSLESIWTRPKIKHAGIWDEIMNTWVMKALAGETPIQEALDNSCEELRKELDLLGYYD